MAERDEVLAVLTRAVREQRTALVGLGRREGLTAEDALDCVHDALCTFLEKALRGELPAAAATGDWLAGMVVNTARNKRRRHHLAAPHEPIEPDAGGDELPLDVLMAHAEDCGRLEGCLSQLCQPQRTVVMMRLLEERPGEDVASALGLTRGYVDVLLHRAKAALRVCMLREPTGPR